MNTEQGKLVTLMVYNLVDAIYTWNVGYKYYFNKNILNTTDTFICIFGPQQEKSLEFFLRQKDINIIYKSPKAVNRRPGHGTESRNTLIVFELSSPVVPDSEVTLDNEQVSTV